MSKLIIWLAINRAINGPQLTVSSYIPILQLPNESSRLSGEEVSLRKTHFTARETESPHLTPTSLSAALKTSFSSMLTSWSWGVGIIRTAAEPKKLGSALCTRLLFLGHAFSVVQPEGGPLLRACRCSAISTRHPFARTDSAWQSQQVSANLLERPGSDQH